MGRKQSEKRRTVRLTLASYGGGAACRTCRMCPKTAGGTVYLVRLFHRLRSWSSPGTAWSGTVVALNEAGWRHD